MYRRNVISIKLSADLFLFLGTDYSHLKTDDRFLLATSTLWIKKFVVNLSLHSY